VRIDPYDHSRVLPDLAESWTTSSDGTLWTFKTLSRNWLIPWDLLKTATLYVTQKSPQIRAVKSG
jgi:ABC-type oligopeptide transport system substrate-binding subunit